MSLFFGGVGFGLQASKGSMIESLVEGAGMASHCRLKEEICRQVTKENKEWQLCFIRTLAALDKVKQSANLLILRMRAHEIMIGKHSSRHGVQIHPMKSNLIVSLNQI